MSNPELSPRERSLLGKIAQGLVAVWNQLQLAWVRFADSSQHAWWFPFLLATLVAFDAFVVILPGDVVVSLAVLSNPRRWYRLALVSAVGSTLGSFALYLVIHHFGKRGLDNLTASGLEFPRWQDARGFFRHYGLFSLVLGSLLPGGSWPPVVMAGLSDDRWAVVLSLLMLGRLARFFVLSFGTREGWAIFQAVKQEAHHRESKK
jgi:membrane protein YqaA with SNARE-associated domain